MRPVFHEAGRRVLPCLEASVSAGARGPTVARQPASGGRCGAGARSPPAARLDDVAGRLGLRRDDGARRMHDYAGFTPSEGEPALSTPPAVGKAEPTRPDA